MFSELFSAISLAGLGVALLLLLRSLARGLGVPATGLAAAIVLFFHGLH